MSTGWRFCLRQPARPPVQHYLWIVVVMNKIGWVSAVKDNNPLLLGTRVGEFWVSIQQRKLWSLYGCHVSADDQTLFHSMLSAEDAIPFRLVERTRLPNELARHP
jgi:hypothetical protein